MAIIVEGQTDHGFSGTLYWRFNSIDGIPNRDPDGTRPACNALFRAFMSEQHFRDGKHFVAERQVEFVPTWESDIRSEAYAALKASPGFEGALDA